MRSILGLMVLAVVATACSDDAGNNGACGNGEVAAGEQCDDGNTSDGDGCSSTCFNEVPNTCGNGEVDVSREDCDDGNTIAGDGCSSTCHNECGNGMLDGNEACDDGNLVPADGCTAMCIVEAGYTCTGEPSDCIKPTGTCDDPFVVMLTNNAGTLVGMGTGDTSTGTDQVMEAPCDGPYDSGSGKDHLWQFTLTETRDVTIEIDGATSFDSTLRLLALACDQTSEIAEHVGFDGCSDDIGNGGEVLAYTALPAGTYYVLIDAYDSTEMGTYTFRVTATTSKCGNGTTDTNEQCDDGNTAMSDGCSATCDVELGYVCTGTPSVCTSACGSGSLEAGEECDDDNTVAGDRCSPTCTLEFDTMEAEPNNTAATAQVLSASNHIVRGALTGGDIDLYTFTLTAPATVDIEIYDLMDPMDTYEGVGMHTDFDCDNLDTELFLFGPTGDVTMEMTALAADDEEGDESCSYIGPGDTDGPDPMQGVLPAGTYTIKVNNWFMNGSAPRYLLDLQISSGPSTPQPPVPGDLVLNEFMAGDNTSDTNCDGQVTGTNDEFVELVNVSSKTLDLTGVTITDSVVLRHTFAAGTSGQPLLAPGKAVVVWTGGTPACPGVTNWFIASSGQLGLNDAGDTITIKNAAMVDLLVHTYPAATLNVSSNRSPDVVGTTFSLHTAVTGAVGAWSPGLHANGTAF